MAGFVDKAWDTRTSYDAVAFTRIAQEPESSGRFKHVGGCASPSPARETLLLDMQPMRYNSLLEQLELFQPGENEYLEIRARDLGQDSRYKINDADIEDLVAQKTRIPDGMRKRSEIFRAGPVPQLPFSAKAFDKLVRGYKLPLQTLEMHYCHANAGCGSKFALRDKTSGNVSVLSFLLVIRLQSCFASLGAFSHDMNNGITTGIILHGDEDNNEIQAMLQHHRSLIGQPLLLPIILLNISLNSSTERSLDTKSKLDYIEDATQQHTWTEVVANRYTPNPNDVDIETLMRLAHGCKIEVAVAQRKIKVASSVASLLQQTCTEFHNRTPGGYEIEEWIGHLNSQVQMLVTDVEYLMQRAETQISAIYSISSQQDGAATREVALQTQMVAEATKRDSSAMKSLAFLGALFFPGAFVAAVFGLNPVKDAPFRTYWAITVPLTVITLVLWFGWVTYRGRVYTRAVVRGTAPDYQP